MLYELEWNTPHTSPGGKSVKDWVAEIKEWEEKGWLDDPIARNWCPQETRRQHKLSVLCQSMCWRERCHRAGRCKTVLKLAIREFQPEFGIVGLERAGFKSPFTGEPDPEKLAIMNETFDRIEAACPNFFKRPRAANANEKAKGKAK
jgi:hypothetical protein